MGRHDAPPPQPDPSGDVSKPGQPLPSREPGKQEDEPDKREEPGKHEKK